MVRVPGYLNKRGKSFSKIRTMVLMKMSVLSLFGYLCISHQSATDQLLLRFAFVIFMRTQYYVHFTYNVHLNTRIKYTCQYPVVGNNNFFIHTANPSPHQFKVTSYYYYYQAITIRVSQEILFSKLLDFIVLYIAQINHIDEQFPKIYIMAENFKMSRIQDKFEHMFYSAN